MTSIIEPCDIAIFRALKASVRRSWARAAAKDILNGADDVGNLLRTPQLRSDMVGLLHAGNSHADAYREGLEAPLVLMIQSLLMLDADEERARGGILGDRGGGRCDFGA